MADTTQGELKSIIEKCILIDKYHYGVIVPTQRRRQEVYREILAMLKNLATRLEEIIEKVVSCSIYFKNGSYIKFFSENEFCYRGRGYHFDDVYSEDNIYPINNFYEDGQLYPAFPMSAAIPNISINTEFHSTTVNAPNQFSQIDENTLWEEMILKGITKERLKNTHE